MTPVNVMPIDIELSTAFYNRLKANTKSMNK